MKRQALARKVLVALALWGLLVAAIVGLLNIDNPNPDARAIVFMGLILIGVWCVLGGTVMFLGRHLFVRWATSIRLGWKVRFVLLATLFALLEEAVTTSLTNAAPLLGAASSAARITVSTNYFEVISNSVLAFIPWFICWAWLLDRYDFSPSEVFLLLGLTGTIAEATLDSAFGWNDLVGMGMWVYVYGLMVYLPALTVPTDRDAHPARWYHLPVAILLPLIVIIPFAGYLAFMLVRKGGSRAWQPNG